VWRRGGAGFPVALADSSREALSSLPLTLAGVVDAAGVSRQGHRSERLAARPEIVDVVLPPEGASDCGRQTGPVAAAKLMSAWEESCLFPACCEFHSALIGRVDLDPRPSFGIDGAADARKARRFH